MSKANNTSKSLSINQRRWKKFKGMRRGYYSMIILLSAYALSFFLPLMVNNKALLVSYNGEWSSPAARDFFASLPLVGGFAPSSFDPAEQYGEVGNQAEANYRVLQAKWEDAGSENYVIMPLYPFGPNEDVTVGGNEKFIGPFEADGSGLLRPFGTDDVGRDVLSRMAYGFQVSMSFALLIAILEYLIGIPVGAVMGYFGGFIDLGMQRVMEIWHALPFLFLIIIIVSFVEPTFTLLVFLLVIFSWLGIATQMRAQFYRERSRDYVAAAVSIGVPTRSILIKHILPNTLVPIITFFPFALVGGISALVSLDYLGFGMPPPTPSWGQMIGVGLSNITRYWLVVVPFGAMFLTLTLVVFIGEGIREAFDPKVFSRLR
ncbi:MAG: ABC transporter permease subunit [Ignavibacteria bacterium]|nr:ABC transporter permease subunit [Ignavibacteria bacterium]